MKSRNRVRVVTFLVRIVQDLVQLNVWSVKLSIFSIKQVVMLMDAPLALFNSITPKHAIHATLIAKHVLTLIIVFKLSLIFVY